jgi:protein TonB
VFARLVRARYIPRMAWIRCGAVGCALLLGGCGDELRRMAASLQGSERPDELPQRLNNPFHYPPALYEQKVQGNVVLRLFIDTAGRVLPESTQVLQSSGYAALDSAAVRGSQELEFSPARRKGRPMAVSVRHPVYFRRRDVPPLPGDTVLRDTHTIDRP